MKEQDQTKKTKEIIEEGPSIRKKKVERFVSLALRNFEEESK